MLKRFVRFIHKDFVPFSIIIICTYALYLRIASLYEHTLWLDELWQLNQMKGSFLEMIKGFSKSEYGVYLSGDFYLIYPFFKIFSYNKWGLAIPHIISTLAGFYILYLICKRYFRSSWSYLITFVVVCFNATLIEHATEIRVYAVLPTLALATFYLFQIIADLDFKLSKLKKIFFIIFFIIVIWFHVYGILIFLTSFIFAILAKVKEKSFRGSLKNVISFMAPILILAMPLWLYSIFGPHIDAYQRHEDIFKYIPNPLYNIIGFLKGIFCNLIGYKYLYFLLPSSLIPFIFHYRNRSKQLLFILIMVIFPIASIFLIDIIGKYWFLQRQFIWVMPLFAFFLGWVWDSFSLPLRGKSHV